MINHSQRSLHKYISLTTADLRRIRKVGRQGSRFRVLPVDIDTDTIDPIQEYSHALIGEVQNGLLDAVVSRTQIFRQSFDGTSTSDVTPISTSENTPVISKTGTPVFSSPNGSRRNSKTLGCSDLPKSDITQPLRSSERNNTPTSSQNGSSFPSPFSSQISSRPGSPLATRKSSVSRKLFFSQKELDDFLDNCEDADSLNPIHHAAKG